MNEVVSPIAEQELLDSKTNKQNIAVGNALAEFKKQFPDLSNAQILQLSEELREKQNAEKSPLPDILSFPEKAQPILQTILKERKAILEDILAETDPEEFLNKYHSNKNYNKSISDTLTSEVREITSEQQTSTNRDMGYINFWISSEFLQQEAEYYKRIREKALSIYNQLNTIGKEYVDKYFADETLDLASDIADSKRSIVRSIINSKFLAHATSRVADVFKQGGLLTRSRVIDRTGVDPFNTDSNFKTNEQEKNEVTFSEGAIWERYASFGNRNNEATWKRKGKQIFSGVFLYPVAKILNGNNTFYSADGLHILPDEGEIPLSELKFITDRKNWEQMTAKERVVLEKIEGKPFWAPKAEVTVTNDSLSSDQLDILQAMTLKQEDGSTLTLVNDRESRTGVTTESVQDAEEKAKATFESPQDIDSYQIFPTGDFEKSLGGYMDTYKFEKK